MISGSRNRALRQLLAIALFVSFSVSVRADGSDWWRTPEQRARAAYEAGDFEQLRDIAPDAAWQGVAQHKSQEFEAAAKTFSNRAFQLQTEGKLRESNRALYNQGVSEVRAGQYEKAVQSFDQVLQQDPEFDDARHNRDIAQRLLQQQQPPSQQSGENGDDGDSSSEQSDQQQSDSSGEQSGESQAQDPGESQQQSGQQSQDSDGQSQDDSDSGQTQSQAQQMQDEQAARDALAAEAASGEDSESDSGELRDASRQLEQPLSESEQATEQWLRRIPDDPAGLLRRKLEQSHRTEYPEVRDAREPW